MFVLGTAGHIDHGKSALVQTLTGIDPDRLAAEKERGMTIELGFAWLKLPSGREVGIVDVPGHERFVRNMLAGAGGIDIAMLVIAANEGVMHQTKEHLAILDLLGVSKGVVAITKKDLVDDEWLDLVKLDIEDLLKHTTLAAAPVIPVSVVTREGIVELLSTIDSLLDNTEPKKDKGKPRLPIDRVFTIAGAGTVVTGTLIDGSLNVGQEVEIIPGGLKSRLRSLQTHKTGVTVASPGSRVAANLTGLTTAQVQRGDILTRPGWLTTTQMTSGWLEILDDAKYPLKNNSERSFYLLASEAMVKIRLLEVEELKPGESSWAQFLLDRPVPIVDGDHYIIRSTTETLGGGVIVDAHARRLPRFNQEAIEKLKIRQQGSPEELVIAILTAKRFIESNELIIQVPLPSDDIKNILDDLLSRNEIVRLGQGEHSLLFSLGVWNSIGEEAKNILNEYHSRFPARTGMPKTEWVNRLKLGKYASVILERMAADKTLVDEGVVVHLPDFRIQLSPVQQQKIDAFLKSLADNPYSPSGELIPEPDILNLLLEQRQVVKLSEGVVVLSTAYDEAVGKILAYIADKGKITLAEVRDMLQTSRKYAQALLEYLDGQRVTRRVGDERVKY